MKGIIFDIQRFAVHDGPGIRTTVFFKGCSARCGWCHNPESLSAKPQLQYYADRCTGCAKCAVLCEKGVHTIGADGRHSFDRGLCGVCGLCAGECFANALVITGREVKLDDVLCQVLDDKAYYDQSGGGVTLSGGEPVLQGDFCEALLKSLKAEGIHTCLQTAGFYPFGMLERLLPYLDLIMYDIKGLSDNVYEEHIHADKSLAMGNLKNMEWFGVPVTVRTPCVAGVNDSAEEIMAISKFISGMPHVREYRLIPCHGLGKVKYDVLGQPFRPYEAPSKARMLELEKITENFIKGDGHD